MSISAGNTYIHLHNFLSVYEYQRCRYDNLLHHALVFLVSVRCASGMSFLDTLSLYMGWFWRLLFYLNILARSCAHYHIMLHS